MAQKIPQSFLMDLLARTNIVTLVQNRMAIKKAGNDYIAQCPFHQDKSPSFSVSEKKQFFYCFGCGEHGNAIRFLMQYDHLDFISAVETLAAQAGMTLPQTQHDGPNYQAHYALMQACMDAYHTQLQHPEAQAFCTQRGIPHDIAQAYQLGFVPEGWRFLEQHLPKDPKSIKMLLDLGMLITSKKDSPHRHYDRFRGRFMFPIRSERGQVLAFGGRTMGDQQPKYLNSPETPIFHKRQALYGLYEAKQRLHTLTSLLVVEGYMDVVALASHGIHHAVATLGTAITTHHLHSLFRHTQRLVFCFDGDTAGRKAAWKACTLSLPLMHDGREASFLFLPEKEDPDSYLQQHGQAAFEAQCAQARNLSDFFFDHCAKTHDLSTLPGRAAFAKEAQVILSTLPEGIFKALMLKQLSEMIDLPLAQVTALTRPPERNNTQRPTPTEPPPTTKPSPQPVQPSSNMSPTANRLVKRALALLLHYPTIGTGIDLNAYLPQVEAPQGPAWQMLTDILDLLNQAHPPTSTGTLMTHFHEHPHAKALAKMAASKLLTPEGGAKDELVDVLKHLHRAQLQHTIDGLLQHSRQTGLDEAQKAQLQALLQTKSNYA